MEATSEQELKQLLDEGKITEAEYRDLLEAIRQKETVQKPVEKPKDSKPRSGYGKAALILMIAGLVFPLLALVVNIFLVSHRQGPTPKMFITTGPFILLGLFCEFLAFIFGIIGWKTPQGKITAIGVPCMGLLIVLGFFVLFFNHFRYARVKTAMENVAQEERYRLEAAHARRSKCLEIHKAYPLDSMDGVLTQDGVEFDKHISSDGNGSLKISTNSSDDRVIHLFETGPISIENRVLIYSARMKSDLDQGRAYLEMWCSIPDKGEFFSRGLVQPISGKTHWITLQTPFRLARGQIPFNVKLNLVIAGKGTVWIDDIKLLSSPLN